MLPDTSGFELLETDSTGVGVTVPAVVRPPTGSVPLYVNVVLTVAAEAPIPTPTPPIQFSTGFPTVTMIYVLSVTSGFTPVDIDSIG